MALVSHTSHSLDLRSAIISFLTDFSTETTPNAAKKEPDFRRHLRSGTSVFITFLPGSDFKSTIDTAAKLRREGFNPVPHLAARSIPSFGRLDENLRKLKGEADVTEVLVIGGGTSLPVGEFENSMQILDTGLLDKHGIRRIGVAGHPEGSPDIDDDAIADALVWKNAFADRTGADVYIVTQMCFDADTIIAWDKRLQAAGNRLTIRVGLPGLATIKTLLNYARICGIGPSARFLRKQSRNLSKLFSLSTPDKLIARLAAYRAGNRGSSIVSCHLYPLGGLEKTARWIYQALAGEFTIEPSADGFSVQVADNG